MVEPFVLVSAINDVVGGGHIAHPHWVLVFGK